MKEVCYVLGAMINAIAGIYICSKLGKIKINFKSIKTYIYYILLVGIMILAYYHLPDVIRIVFITIIFMGFNYLLFKVDIRKCIFGPIFSQLLLLVSEIIFSVVVLGILKIDMEVASKTLFGTFIPNIVVSILASFLVNVPAVQMAYDKILSKTDKIKIKNLLIWVFLAMFSINIIFSITYYRVSPLGLLIINTGMILIYTIIIMKIIDEQNNHEKMSLKYNTTLSSLKEYEEILNKYRVSNHENKNQLLIIRNMIVKKEKGIPTYIDKLIDNKIKDDEKLMFDVNIIPAGGLRAVVYSKMLVMKEKNIDCMLNIDKKLRTVELLEMGDDILLNVCHIIGVFLDNAIEAVELLEEKYTDIHMYMEDGKFVISVSNNFAGGIDLEKIETVGYTTKENGHGYGLSLVRKIIEENPKLEKKTDITRDVFTQTLKIKM